MSVSASLLIGALWDIKGRSISTLDEIVSTMSLCEKSRAVERRLDVEYRRRGGSRTVEMKGDMEDAVERKRIRHVRKIRLGDVDFCD